MVITPNRPTVSGDGGIVAIYDGGNDMQRQDSYIQACMQQYI